jgi:polar amino acid transport system permease protein
MTPDWSYIAQGVTNTLVLTFFAFAAGSLLGAVLLGLQMSRSRGARAVAKVYVEMVRAVPPIVWIFLIYFGLPETGVTLQAMPACLIALSLIAASYLAEIFRAGLAAVDRGQWEASDALGLGGMTTVHVVIAPQLVRAALPAMTTYLIGLLKDSAIASIVGVAEITFRAGSETQRTGSGFTAFVFAGALYLVLSFALAMLGRATESSLEISRRSR